MRAVTVLLALGVTVGMALAGAPPAAAQVTAKADACAAPPKAFAANGMDVLWQTDLLLERGAALKNLWLVADYLVGRSSDNRVFVANAATGVRLWSDIISKPNATVWPPCIDRLALLANSRVKVSEGREPAHTVLKDTLWFPTTTQLVGVQALDGRLVEAVSIDFAPAGRPATNGALCFVPDGKGWLQAVSILSRLPSWGRWTEDAVTAGPVVDSSFVYFASQNGTVYASTQNIRRVTWEHKTEAPIVADLKRTKSGLILAASLDYTLYAFQGSSGRLAWRFNAGEPLQRAPYAFGGQTAGAAKAGAAKADPAKAAAAQAVQSAGQVFLFAKEAGMVAIDMSNGRAQWTLKEGADLVAADANNVYVTSRNGDLVALDRKDGKVVFTLALAPGTIVAADESDTGILYLAVPGGQVMAVAAKKKEP